MGGDFFLQLSSKSEQGKNLIFFYSSISFSFLFPNRVNKKVKWESCGVYRFPTFIQADFTLNLDTLKYLLIHSNSRIQVFQSPQWHQVHKIRLLQAFMKERAPLSELKRTVTGCSQTTSPVIEKMFSLLNNLRSTVSGIMTT